MKIQLRHHSEDLEKKEYLLYQMTASFILIREDYNIGQVNNPLCFDEAISSEKSNTLII